MASGMLVFRSVRKVAVIVGVRIQSTGKTLLSSEKSRSPANALGSSHPAWGPDYFSPISYTSSRAMPDSRSGVLTVAV